MDEYIIYLAVDDNTGEVDYGYVEYGFKEPPDDDGFPLIKGCSWRPFRLVRADE